MVKTINNFTFLETKIAGLYEITVKRYGDARGYFTETYKESDFVEAGLNYRFIQDNQSKSKKGFFVVSISKRSFLKQSSFVA